MFSDTHLHLSMVVEKSGLQASYILSKLAVRKVFFAQDIGTECDDLREREHLALRAISEMSSKDAKACEDFLYFSGGIFPSLNAIENRVKQVQTLKEQIEMAKGLSIPLFKKISAIGECGIDHHINDGRNVISEKELFIMQLLLAKELSLPVIIHSRNGFSDTLDCIKEVGYNNGVIHCFSYGIDEAKAFLDLGWYISFTGSVTYTKKSKMEDMKSLLAFIPKDRILIETDAPYLAPVPLRGKTNLPYYIEHTYSFVSTARNISIENLCAKVDENIRRLFHV